ncbi:MAG: lipopolysaccharide transport periplasmic protein LptA [Arcobacter sp.]|nr:lipopolysaccharide transport periplasmic protein LptA [Arcobacter sp.]
MRYFIILLASMSLVFAATTQKLIIDAKEFMANDKKGISSFKGNVKIQMNKDKLSANEVDIFFKSKDKNTKTPTKYIANGNVKFTIVTHKKHYVGKGNKIIYSPIKQEYTVIGNGFLEEKNDGRKIYGDKIYVNQQTGEARVSGSDKKPVRFIINIKRGED